MILVIASLALIFAYQAYWLINLYTTQTRVLEIRLLEAMRACDYNEMVLRVKRLREQLNMKGSISIAAGYNQEEEKSYLASSASVNFGQQGKLKERRIKKDTVISSSSNVSVKEGGLGMILEKQHTTEQLALYFQQGIHFGLDTFSDPDIYVFDSLLTMQLKEMNIPHEHQLLYLQRGSNIDSTFSYVDTLKIVSTPRYIHSEKVRGYEHCIDINENFFYLLHLNPVSEVVLSQMTGILTASSIILLILAFSFYYLIRTLLRQKTLEEMKSDFTNNITHELKTPIAIAYAANDALLNFDKADCKETRNRYLYICQEQLRYLSSLVEQILSMSVEKRTTIRLDKEEILLKEMIASLIEHHRLKTDKPICVNMSIYPEEMTVYASRTHLTNIISNLIDNDVKYSKDVVEIEIVCKQCDDCITIIVRDNGIGMSQEHQKHIFDKFYRIPTGNIHNVKGYGLGLYYVKSMVEKHGGNINVSSEKGKGSEFKIVLYE